MTNFEIFCRAFDAGVGFTLGAIFTIAGAAVIIGVLCCAFGGDEK